MSVRRAVAGLLALVRKPRLDRELETEIQAHLEMAERDALAHGLSPDQARREARLRFGGIEQVKEEHRDRRSLPRAEVLLKDFRYGLSSLRRDPGFALVSIAVLALGIGANTAMFSIVDAVLLKPLPYPEPERMATVTEAQGEQRWGVSSQNFLDWQRLSASFEALSAETYTTAAVVAGGEPERWNGRLVSANFFQAYGVKPLLGRTFAPGEDRPGADRVLMLSHAAWQTRFGGAHDILNRTLLLDGEPCRIIGVLPPGSFDREDALYWKPLAFKPAQLTRETMWLLTAGRLRRGVSLDQARREMLQISAGLESVNPPWKKGWRAVVDPFGQELVGARLRQTLYVAFGAVLMVLLIACSNVSNLLLARGATRGREMAVRVALGASRGRLVGQLLAESLALCTLGGLAGVALAHLLLRAALPLLTELLPPTAAVALDLRVLAFSGAVVLGVALLTGLLPALQSSAGAVSAGLNEGARGSTGSRAILRRVIVVGEVAVSLVLICGAGLMFRSLVNLQHVNAGVRLENVITTSVELPAAAHPKPESVIQFADRLVGRLQAVPGVERVGLASGLPLSGFGETGVTVAPGLVRGGVTTAIKRVDQHYFRTLDIPVLFGRGFDGRDRRGGQRVVIVNQELGAQLSGGRGAASLVGRKVGLTLSPYGTAQAELVWVQVIGVIRSERVGDLRDAQRPIAYVPVAQEPNLGMCLILRTRGEPAAVMPGVREAVRELDPRLPLGRVSTMAELKAVNLNGMSRSTWVIVAFALVAALLAAFGLYGVLAQSVNQQRREIGIRMALGAGPRQILSRVLGHAVGMVAVGLAIGLAGAFALTGVLKSLLFHVPAVDPAAFGAACVLMMLLALAAVFLPANRAARVDPVTTLRDDG